MNDYLFDMPVIRAPLKTMLSTNNNGGSEAEIAFALQATVLGYEVFMPLHHATKADLIICKHGQKPMKVQVKRATFQKYSYKVLVGAGRPSRLHVKKNNEKRYVKYVRGDFDLFAVYIADRKEFFLSWLNDCLEHASMHIKPHTRLGNWEILEDWQ